MSLEDQIREMAAQGELTHLSLTPIHEGKQHVWAASFCAASPIGGYTFVLESDPVEALCRAIRETKLKTRKPRVSEPAQ
jgi:hypothetical protein